MKLRPSVVLGVVLAAAAVEVGLLVPAQAAPPPAPVTGLAVQGQTQGTGQSWTITADWTAVEGADGYRVAITDGADGTNTPGSHYASRDVTGTSATLTTDRLATGQTYWVAVRSLDDGATGDAVTTAFTAMALDTTGPTGTFTLDATHGYIGGGEFLMARLPAPFRGPRSLRGLQDFWDDAEAESGVGFQVKQTALSDDSSAPAEITRALRLDTGRTAERWTDALGTLIYSKAGVYHPEVVLTDRFGNTSTVPLGTITVELDEAGPVVRITRPRPAMRPYVGGWRTIRGTVRDVKSGPLFVAVMVAEQRSGGIWWAYDFDTATWTKGFRNLDRTLEETEAAPAFMEPFNGHWRTPAVRALRPGVLHVETIAVDQAFNLTVGPIIHRRIVRAS